MLAGLSFCSLVFLQIFSHIIVPLTERDIKVVRPLYSVEVTETETAKFETEISEEDVHGNWKLKGEALHQSPVSTPRRYLTIYWSGGSRRIGATAPVRLLDESPSCLCLRSLLRLSCLN